MTVCAHRIVTERLVLRPWALADAPLLRAAIKVNPDHFRPMDWAETLPRMNMHRWGASFSAHEHYMYAALDRNGRNLLGGIGLQQCADRDWREIGYWAHPQHLRQGYATEMTIALTWVAFRVHCLRGVEIGHAPANLGSPNIADNLGYSLSEGVWRLSSEEFEQSLMAEQKSRPTALTGRFWVRAERGRPTYDIFNGSLPRAVPLGRGPSGGRPGHPRRQQGQFPAFLVLLGEVLGLP